MTKAEYFALPNSERYAAAQAILKGRGCIRLYGQDVSEAGFKSAGKVLSLSGTNTYRIEFDSFMDVYFVEIDKNETTEKSWVFYDHEFESKALIFEPTNL